MRYNIILSFKDKEYIVEADTIMEAKKIALEEYDTNDDMSTLEISRIEIEKVEE